ncbi:MAG: polysaccharide biosynthesis tyrosine autokinase, partial [Longimicrobiales bacterium]
TALQLVPSVTRSSQLQTALNEASAADANIRSLLTQLTDQHPLVVVQQQKLDSLKAYVIPSYANELVRQLNTKLSESDRLISNSARELREIPERSKQEMMLERRRAIAEELYRYLERETHTARLAEVTTVPDMQILDWPSEPNNPVPDERLRLLLMFMAGSLGLGLLGAIARDRFDPRLRYPDEVTGGMGLFILGAVPALRRGKLGSTDMALAVEAFRAIQLSILHAHGAQAPLAVTLTSPGASDGKSFVTSNLAIAFADMGHRTIVVDGDVRRGTVHQLMGTTHKPGLTDYLAGQATRDQIVQNTRYSLLDMIGCGSRGEAGPKLLGSTAMTRLIDELRSEYDVILVDSPPLGACVDPMILGTLTRNLVLVLRTGTTDRAMAESKLLILDRLPVRVVGAVLNDVPARGPYRYYSYLSGYEVLDDAQTGQEVGSLPAAESNGASGQVA